MSEYKPGTLAWGVENGYIDLEELTERRREFTKEAMFQTIDVDAMVSAVEEFDKAP